MKNIKRLKGISLFSGAGIGETYFERNGIDIIVANELLESRASLYKKLSPKTNVVCGDIRNKEVYNSIIRSCSDQIDFLLASPPCQGMSVAGKNRCQTTMAKDDRNFLVNNVFDMIKDLKPSFIIIENVPALLKIRINYEDILNKTVLDILNSKFGETYKIEGKVLDSSEFCVPQARKRAIIKMVVKGLKWDWPEKCKRTISVKEAIGHLPSLEAGEKSNIKWHYARNHVKRNIDWMKHTPTGQSAFFNVEHYPQKKDGTRIKGYESSYRRIRWDSPAPTITIRNDCIASQRNVHPGRRLKDGTYSDARVLTPLELMLLNSLPENWNIPDDTPELLIRQCIGESIPPLLLEKIIKGISYEQKN